MGHVLQLGLDSPLPYTMLGKSHLQNMSCPGGATSFFGGRGAGSKLAMLFVLNLSLAVVNTSKEQWGLRVETLMQTQLPPFGQII